jgi:hypothetical protein
MAESATSVGSLTFLGLFAMFSPSPHLTFYATSRPCAPSRKFGTGSHAFSGANARPLVGLSAYIRKHPIG